MIEGRQILLHGPTGIRISSPLVPKHRPLPVGIGGDQAGIDRKAVTAHQAFAQASLDHGLEQVPQNIALPEPAVPVA
jgi:hypothetical protein